MFWKKPLLAMAMSVAVFGSLAFAERYGLHGEYAHPPRATSGPPVVTIHMKKGEYCFSHTGPEPIFTGTFSEFQKITVTASKLVKVITTVTETVPAGTLLGYETRPVNVTILNVSQGNPTRIEPSSDGSWGLDPTTSGGTDRTGHFRLDIELNGGEISVNEGAVYGDGRHELDPFTVRVCTVDSPE